jgi:hypothetical protein
MQSREKQQYDSQTGVASTVISSMEGYKPPEDPMDDYRFYQCVLHPLHTVCTAITTADVRRTDPKNVPIRAAAAATAAAATGPPSILMAVPKYIPQSADTFWIRINMFFMQKTSIR